MRAAPETVVLPDADAVALAVAGRLRDLSLPPHPAPFAVALAGGSTPRRLYELLAHAPFRAGVRWDRLELFFGDERAVPPDHPDSNFGMVRRALLAHVTVYAHPMPAETGDADAYARLLAERIAPRRHGVPVLDLVLLGVGEDGHAASLFPATAALHETARWVVATEVPRLATRRMTLTYPLLNAAARVWFLVTGASKRRVVERCLAGGADAGEVETCPALGVRPEAGELVWWLDAAAAGQAAAGAAAAGREDV